MQSQLKKHCVVLVYLLSVQLYRVSGNALHNIGLDRFLQTHHMVSQKASF